MPIVTFANPETLSKPLGQYSHVARIKASELLSIAGQLAIDRNGNLVGDGDFDAQCTQVYANIAAALKSAGAAWSQVAQFTTYVVKPEHVEQFRAFRLREYPKMFPNGVYPPNTLLIVKGLVRPEFLIEIQTIAAL